MNEKLRKTIKDLIKITHFHKRIILHKIFKLNQRMSLSHEKRVIFPKTKYDLIHFRSRTEMQFFVCFCFVVMKNVVCNSCGNSPSPGATIHTRNLLTESTAPNLAFITVMEIAIVNV